MILFEPPCTPNNFQVRHGYDVRESDSPSFVRQANMIRRRSLAIDFETTDEATAAYCRGLWRQTFGGILPVTLASPIDVEGLFVISGPPRVAHSHGSWTVSIAFEEVPA